MARIRNLKPEFWTDGNIVQLSFAARLFYQGTWNFALCDRGHLPDDPMELKLKILPADDVDPAALVAELIKFGRLVRETAPDGRRYLRIARLADHNKVDPRWSPRCPYCAAESVSSDETRQSSPKLPDTPVSHTEPPRNSPQEGKGREGKVREGKKDTSSELAPRAPDTTPDRPEIERLCTHLADLVEANGSKRPAVTQKWRDAVRLMLDRDKRTEEQIRGAIDWCQADEFWRRNVMSMPKLREQYDRLRLQAGTQRVRAAPKPSTTDQRVAQAQAAAGNGQVRTLAQIFERTGHRPHTIPGEIA